VHLRSTSSIERRVLFNSRQLLVDARKAIGTNIKSWLRGRLQGVRGRATSKHFSKSVRELALQHTDGLPIAIDVLLSSFDELTEQIDRLNEELEQRVKNDPVCRLLMTMPGVGPVVSMAYQAQLDDPHRFASADHVGSYLALVPGEATTGGKVVRTSVLRAGPKRLKALLVQAAWSMWRSKPNDPLVLWAHAKAKTRGKRIAIVALARKMSTILWSMWRHDKPYDPQRASTYEEAVQPSA
jgi:transposase